MVKEGIADFAISEDSDLITFGCPKLVMKINFLGNCTLFSWEDFKANSKLATDKNLSVL
jgi:exonuclease-1